MKRYFITILSAVLALVSFFVFMTAPSNAVSAGAGSGKDSEVENLNDVYSVLEYVANRQQSSDNLTRENDYISLLSTKDNSSYDDTNIDIKRHTSVTVTEIGEQSYYRTVNDQSGSFYHYDISTTTDSKVYLTTDAVYYVLKQSLRSGELYTYIDCELFYDDDEIFIKFNDYFITSSGTSGTVKDEYIGQWIELSAGGVYDIFESVNLNSLSNLADIQELIRKDILNLDGIVSKKENDTYSYTEQINSLGADISIDLSDPKDFSIQFYKNEDQSGSDYDYIKDKLSFSNIDNTVIKENIEADYVMDSDSISDIFNTVEHWNNQ